MTQTLYIDKTVITFNQLHTFNKTLTLNYIQSDSFNEIYLNVQFLKYNLQLRKALISSDIKDYFRVIIFGLFLLIQNKSVIDLC